MEKTENNFILNDIFSHIGDYNKMERRKICNYSGQSR